MNSDLVNKLDEITNIINNSYELRRMKELRNIIEKDKDLMNKINTIKNSEYSNKYVELKKEVLSNEYYKEYRLLEDNLYYLIENINLKLNELVKE